MHFSHINASLYTKWPNTDLWLTDGFRVTQHYLRTVTSAVAPKSAPARTASPVNEGLNLDDDEIKA